MKTKSWMISLMTKVVSPMFLGLFIGTMSANTAYAFPGEDRPEEIRPKPVGNEVIKYGSGEASKTVLKLRAMAEKSFKSMARLRAQARVKAAAGIAASPPVLLNANFDQLASPSTLARNWVEGGDCMDASWGGYKLVTQTDANQNSNRVMRLIGSGSSPSSSGCQILPLNQDAARPIFIGGWMKGQSIVKKPRATKYGVYIGAYFVLQDGSAVECYNVLRNMGTFPWRWVGLNSYADCGITQPISLVAVIPKVTGVHGTVFVDNMQLVDKELVSGSPAGQVSLVFDDGYKSDITTVLPILAAHNIPATSALISSSVGVYSGTLTYDEAYSLIKAGWDAQSHSITHPDITQLSDIDAKKELADSQATLRAGLSAAALSQGDNSFDSTSQAAHFIWPMSALNGNTVGWAQQNYQSGRTVFGGLNGYGLYPWMIYSWSMDSATSLADIQTWLNDACVNKRWLVLSSHRVGAPIAGQDNYYSVSPSFLENVAQLIENEISHCPTPFHAVNYSAGFNSFAVSPSDKPLIP
ncbi:polysaccharide deacetylase family protein [Methylomagnum sp.]